MFTFYLASADTPEHKLMDIEHSHNHSTEPSELFTRIHIDM